jgi:peptidoglycan-N-acetylglucosamine deacetylase
MAVVSASSVLALVAPVTAQEAPPEAPGTTPEPSAPAGTDAPSPPVPGTTESQPAPCSQGEVVLTFDDGPRPEGTGPILDVLRDRQVPATFFVVGLEAEKFPDLLRRIVAEGHTLANHTWNHARLTSLSKAEIRRELQSLNDEIASHGLPVPTLVRPPFGSTDSRVRSVIERLGMSEVTWSIDPADWRNPEPMQIVDLVLSRLHPDANILLHDGTSNFANTTAALPAIIDGVHAAGYCFGDLAGSGVPAPALPDLRIANGRLTEGRPGAGALMTFPLTLSVPSSQPIRVAWETRDATAVAGEDYEPGSGVVEFAAGTTSQVVEIPILGDDLDERDERFRVRLDDPEGATLVRRWSTGTILDEDDSERVPDDGPMMHALAPEGVEVRLDVPGGTRIELHLATSQEPAEAGTGTGTGQLTQHRSHVLQPRPIAHAVPIVLFDRGGFGNPSRFLSVATAGEAILRQHVGTVLAQDELAGVTP